MYVLSWIIQNYLKLFYLSRYLNLSIRLLEIYKIILLMDEVQGSSDTQNMPVLICIITLLNWSIYIYIYNIA